MDEYIDKTSLFGEIQSSDKSEVTTALTEEGRLNIEDTSIPHSDIDNGASERQSDTDDMETVSNDSECVENGNTTLRLRLIQIATGSQGFFKHQQRGDPELSKQEKRRIVTELLDNRPAVFLQRYGKFLSEDHLDYFEDVIDYDYEIKYYLREARQKQCKYVQEHKIRNRRFKALQKMISEGDDHFSEECMRQRNPLLYDQLIKQYQTQEEKMEQERADMTNCSLSKIILEHMDLNRERDLKKRLAAVDEEEFDTDSEDESEGIKPAVPAHTPSTLTLQEKLDLRREFVDAAYQSFMAGTDPGINYKEIDENADFDDIVLEDREHEERYFDDDDGEIDE